MRECRVGSGTACACTMCEMTVEAGCIVCFGQVILRKTTALSPTFCGAYIKKESRERNLMPEYQVEVWNQAGRFVGPAPVRAERPKGAALQLMRQYGRTALAAGGTPLMVNVKSGGGDAVKHYLWSSAGHVKAAADEKQGAQRSTTIPPRLAGGGGEVKKQLRIFKKMQPGSQEITFSDEEFVFTGENKEDGTSEGTISGTSVTLHPFSHNGIFGIEYKIQEVTKDGGTTTYNISDKKKVHHVDVTIDSEAQTHINDISNEMKLTQQRQKIDKLGTCGSYLYAVVEESNVAQALVFIGQDVAVSPTAPASAAPSDSPSDSHSDSPTPTAPVAPAPPTTAQPPAPPTTAQPLAQAGSGGSGQDFPVEGKGDSSSGQFSQVAPAFRRMAVPEKKKVE